MKLKRKRLVIAASALVAAIAVLVLATMAGQHYMNPDRVTSPTSEQDSSSANTAESPPSSTDAGNSSEEPGQAVRDDLLEFESDEAGFAISYPEDWERVETPPDSTLKFIATPDDQNSLQVRVVDLGFSVGPDELPGMREYTRRQVESGEDVRILAGPSTVELDGLPGYVYVYTFASPDTGETGVHSHYFLFDGDRMFTLVFQALPEERYQELAPLFDTIADSFQTVTP